MADSRSPTAPSGTLRDVTDNPLTTEIARAIGEAGGWIGFDRFMALALYSPGLGYYSGSRPIFGPAGDFTTAPESTDLFGAVVARQLAAWLDNWPGPAPTLYEFGGGSGALAAAILPALAELGFDSLPYRIVELSAPLRRRQRETLAARAPEALDQVQWLDELPARIDGIVIGNEVLDAMPVRVFEVPAGDGSADPACDPLGAPAGAGELVAELGVVLAGSAASSGSAAPTASAASAEAPGAALQWHPTPADPELAARVRCLEQACGPWPRPYRSELAEQAEAWVRTVAARIGTGALLLFDYGFGDSEFYHPQRSTGTLMAHLRHRAHPDVLRDPGEQDITAHVPFSAIQRAAEGAGLETLGYVSQARFLINAGLLDVFAALPREPVTEWAKTAQAVQRLLSEAEMGELFKAIAFGRGLGDEPWLPGFGDGDRSDRL